MDDASLTRMAIEEIVREMHQAKESAMQLPVERKVNPLGKPNKRFLGRTINSMLAHNKRESDRKRVNCNRKLKELDEKTSRVAHNNNYFGEGKKNKSSRDRSRGFDGSNEVCSSSKSDENECSQKIKKEKRKQKHKRRSPSYSSSSVSLNSGDDNVSERHTQFENANMAIELTNFHHYTNMTAIAAAYNHMSHIYSTMLSAAAVGYVSEKPNVRQESRRSNNSISSEITISLSEEGVLSSSPSISSLDTDENGVLTINVSSEESESEDKEVPNQQIPETKKSTTESDVEIILSSDSESENSVGRAEEPFLISVDSDSDESTGTTSSDSVAIVTLPTDCHEELAKEVSVISPKNKNFSNTIELEVDLTKE